jgi:hypothetical protein
VTLSICPRFSCPFTLDHPVFQDKRPCLATAAHLARGTHVQDQRHSGRGMSGTPLAIFMELIVRMTACRPKSLSPAFSNPHRSCHHVCVPSFIPLAMSSHLRWISEGEMEPIQYERATLMRPLILRGSVIVSGALGSEATIMAELTGAGRTPAAGRDGRRSPGDKCLQGPLRTRFLSRCRGTPAYRGTPDQTASQFP